MESEVPFGDSDEAIAFNFPDDKGDEGEKYMYLASQLVQKGMRDEEEPPPKSKTPSPATKAPSDLPSQ